WREDHPHLLPRGNGELLLDLPCVAMCPCDLVRTDPFARLTEMGAGAWGAARAAHAALRVDDDRRVHLDEARLQQRRVREQRAGWIAAWRGDQTGTSQSVAMQFRKTIHRVAEQLGGRVFTVPSLVVGSALQAKVRGEVDHAEPLSVETGDHLG